MILTRLGNKRSMAPNLVKHFPPHQMRIELFFGAGGSFFYLPEPRYSILNDYDNDVYNLYHIVLTNRKELEKQIRLMPISQTLVYHWKRYRETDSMLKAVRFLLLSNFTYLGKGDTLRLGLDNAKRNLINSIEPTFLKLQNSKFTNTDFRDVIPKISFENSVNPKSKAFVYLDPIYLDTEHYYKVPKWTISDTEDCFRIMKNDGIRAAMSEFDHPEVLRLAKKYGMNIIPLKVRQNISNRRKEILLTNYDTNQLQF